MYKKCIAALRRQTKDEAIAIALQLAAVRLVCPTTFFLSNSKSCQEGVVEFLRQIVTSIRICGLSHLRTVDDRYHWWKFQCS